MGTALSKRPCAGDDRFLLHQEFEHRFAIWLDNLEFVHEYNQRHTSHWVRSLSRALALTRIPRSVSKSLVVVIGQKAKLRTKQLSETSEGTCVCRSA